MKKTLLIAAAALAAGIISTEASSVYSQNIVGYANISTPNGGTYLLTVPFSVGVSNGANEIWPLVGGQPTIPDFSQLLTWNGSGYDTYYSDSGSPSLWDDASQSAIPNAPRLLPGQAFFLVPSGDLTNSFTGSIPVNVGTSNNMSLPNGGTYLIGSVVPYGGVITNGTSSGGGLALSSNNGLPDFSQLLIWNGSGYDTYYSDSGSSSLWDDASQSSIPTAPSVSVGQGFFVVPSDNFTWNVGL